VGQGPGSPRVSDTSSDTSSTRPQRSPPPPAPRSSPCRREPRDRNLARDRNLRLASRPPLQLLSSPRRCRMRRRFPPSSSPRKRGSPSHSLTHTHTGPCARASSRHDLRACSGRGEMCGADAAAPSPFQSRAWSPRHSRAHQPFMPVLSVHNTLAHARAAHALRCCPRPEKIAPAGVRPPS